jgi:hypothetical protein
MLQGFKVPLIALTQLFQLLQWSHASTAMFGWAWMCVGQEAATEEDVVLPGRGRARTGRPPSEPPATTTASAASTAPTSTVATTAAASEAEDDDSEEEDELLYNNSDSDVTSPASTAAASSLVPSLRDLAKAQHRPHTAAARTHKPDWAMTPREAKAPAVAPAAPPSSVNSSQRTPPSGEAASVPASSKAPSVAGSAAPSTTSAAGVASGGREGDNGTFDAAAVMQHVRALEAQQRQLADMMKVSGEAHEFLCLSCVAFGRFDQSGSA